MKATLRDGLHPALIAVCASLAMALTGGSLAAQTSAAASPEVTFTKDVAPILEQHCQECHRPNAIAPMSLQTFEEVRPWAKAIKERVSARMMPPWFIDPNVGINQFKNYGGLTDDEIATLAKWVDAGAPRGNPADMPPPVKFDDDIWHIGTPAAGSSDAGGFGRYGQRSGYVEEHRGGSRLDRRSVHQGRGN